VQDGVSGGAQVTGSFSGVDTNGEGQLGHFTNPPDPDYPLEATNFSLTFSDNAVVPALTLNFADLDNFNYQLAPTLGASDLIDNGLTEGIEAVSLDRFYIPGPGPVQLCDGTEFRSGVMAVPEPGTWALPLSGLFGPGALIRRARRASISVRSEGR
jgi:hypothetical protein